MDKKLTLQPQEGSDASQQQRGLRESIMAGVDQVTSSIQDFTAHNLGVALLAGSALALGSCEGRDPVRPQAPYLADHSVVLSCNTGRWVLQGANTQSFRAVVSADGTPIDSRNVVLRQSKDPSHFDVFTLQGKIEDLNAQNVHVDAFGIDENGEPDGTVIPIEGNTNTKGMYGVADCPVGLDR